MFNWDKFVRVIGKYYPLFDDEEKKKLHQIVDMMENEKDERRLKKWSRAAVNIVKGRRLV